MSRISIAELGEDGKGHLAAPAPSARPIPRLAGFANPKLTRFRVAASARPRLMHALERLFKLGFEVLISTIGRSGTRNQHVIVARPHLCWIERSDGGPQAPANAIADDGVADFLGDCESNPWAAGISLVAGAQTGFDNERGCGPARAASDPEKF